MSGDEIRTNRLARLLREGPLDQAKSFAQGMSNAAASNVSGPVDALAWLLRKTGLPIPQNPMGGSEWMAEKGLTAAPNNRLAGLLGEGAGLAAPIAAFAKAPQIAGGLLALDDHAMEMGRRGIERYMDKTGMRLKMFIGPSAKTWNAAKAKQAQDLLDKGVSPEQVWSQTGTFRGADGKLRQEISDHAATMPNFGKNQETKMLSVLDHQSLYDAYPAQQYANVNITSESSLPPHLRKLPFKDAKGSYSHGGDNLDDLIEVTAYTPDSAKSTALHELQHAIQQREGFAKGGSPSQFAGVSAESQKSLDEINAILNSGEYSMKEYQTLLQQKRDILNNSAPGLSSNEQYRRLAGEAEARLTQSRMGMNPMQRAASFPPSMFDVPIEQQIVRFK